MLALFRRLFRWLRPDGVRAPEIRLNAKIVRIPRIGDAWDSGHGLITPVRIECTEHEICIGSSGFSLMCDGSGSWMIEAL